jgi:hypothetical protein
MKFNKGDLVIHARGTIHPHKNLQGVVIRADLFKDPICPMYRVFWYTVGRYQNLDESCLKPLDNSLTT